MISFLPYCTVCLVHTNFNLPHPLGQAKNYLSLLFSRLLMLSKSAGSILDIILTSLGSHILWALTSLATDVTLVLLLQYCILNYSVSHNCSGFLGYHCSFQCIILQSLDVCKHLSSLSSCFQVFYVIERLHQLT